MLECAPLIHCLLSIVSCVLIVRYVDDLRHGYIFQSNAIFNAKPLIQQSLHFSIFVMYVIFAVFLLMQYHTV